MVTLSSQQIAIHEWFASGRGNAQVVARAGTGKTYTICSGIAKAPEQKICYAVFNSKNRKEAKEKILDPRVDVHTLHSLGFAYIRRQWQNTRIDDNSDVEMDRVNSIDPRIPPSVAYCIKKIVSWAKNTTTAMPEVGALMDIAEQQGFEADDTFAEEGWTTPRLAAIAHGALKAALTRDAAGRISFDDMVWVPVAAGFVRPWFELVVVDEAQDMSMPQLTMAQRACKRGGRILVVGDNRQAIYGFRGAAASGMATMARELQAQIFPLTITYRCPKAVVALAQTLVPDYQSAPEAPDGSVREAAESAVLTEAQPGDAVLSRTNAPLMGLCLGLLRKGVSARIEGRDVGRALLGIIKTLKARSVPDFLGRVTKWADRQRARAAAAKRPDDRLQVISDQAETLLAVAEGAASVGEIESRLNSLFQDSDKSPRPAVVLSTVVLSTVHKAKGLEWHKVFVLRGTFRAWAGSPLETEQHNIAYVAITRAKSELVVCGSAPAAAK